MLAADELFQVRISAIVTAHFRIIATDKSAASKGG